MTKKAKRVRSVLCTLVSFIMSLLIAGTVLCATVFVTVLRADFVVRITARSQYAELLSAELKEEFISYGNACNIDAEFFDPVFEKVITPQKISADTEMILRDFYAGSVRDTLPTDELEAKLLEELKGYATQKNFALTDELVGNLQIIASELCEIYNAYASVFSMSYFKTASRMISEYRPYALYAAGICAVGFVISAVVLRLFYQKRKNYLRYFVYAFSGATLMLLIVPLAALLGDLGGRVNIASAALYAMVSGLLNGTFAAVAISAAIPALCTVLLIVLYNRAYRKNV